MCCLISNVIILYFSNNGHILEIEYKWQLYSTQHHRHFIQFYFEI